MSSYTANNTDDTVMQYQSQPVTKSTRASVTQCTVDENASIIPEDFDCASNVSSEILCGIPNADDSETQDPNLINNLVLQAPDADSDVNQEVGERLIQTVSNTENLNAIEG